MLMLKFTNIVKFMQEH